jgi:hypothetical protein
MTAPRGACGHCRIWLTSSPQAMTAQRIVNFAGVVGTARHGTLIDVVASAWTEKRGNGAAFRFRRRWSTIAPCVLLSTATYRGR